MNIGGNHEFAVRKKRKVSIQNPERKTPVPEPITHKGFSLIELLIVVVIISILAAIAVPSFLDAQHRAKSTRAKSDLRSLTTAVEAYRVDHGKYAPCAADFDGLGNPGGGGGIPHFTTPVAYIVSGSTLDIYVGRPNPGRTRSLTHYGYLSRTADNYALPASADSATWYILISNGPDLNSEADKIRAAIDADSILAFVDTIYDPTNGIISDGNLYRANGQFEGPGAGAGHLAHTSVGGR